MYNRGGGGGGGYTYRGGRGGRGGKKVFVPAPEPDTEEELQRLRKKFRGQLPSEIIRRIDDDTRMEGPADEVSATVMDL